MSKRRIAIRTEDFVAAPEPPVLVEGLISRLGVTGLSADPNVGKTFLALEISRRVLLGEPLFDRIPCKRGSVLFIGQDASESDYARQARKVGFAKPWSGGGQHPFACARWLMHQGIDLKSTRDIAEVVSIANRIPNNAYNPNEVIGIEPETDPETGVTIWHEIRAKEFGTALIVLDTMSKLHTAEENSNTEMNLVFGNLRTLANQTKSAVLLLHHHSYSGEGNPGGRWRGASAQEGAIDGWFEIAGRNRDRKQVKVRKFRGIRPDDFTYTMAVDEHEAKFTWDASSATQNIVGDLSAVREVISNLPPGQFRTGDIVAILAEGGMRDLAESTRRNRVSQVFVQLVEQREVEGIGRGLWRRVGEVS